MELRSAFAILLVTAFAAACSGEDANQGGAVAADSGVDAADADSFSDAGAADAATADATDADTSGDPDPEPADAAMDVGLPDVDSDLDATGPTTSIVNGVLALQTPLRARVEDCSAPADCMDADDDGIVDVWENQVLEAFKPALVFDEEEEIVNDPDGVIAHVARVGRGILPRRYVAYITLLYHYDYGSCGTLSSHNGDSERVVVHVEETDDSVILVGAYTAAHEGTLTDHSFTYENRALFDLHYDTSVAGEARWVVYPSKNKHATYITPEVCAGISPIPCFSENCGPAVDPAIGGGQTFPVFNAGEPDTPLLGDLSAVGFPGEDPWADQDFCGGLGGGLCSGSIRSKLTTNPFE